MRIIAFITDAPTVRDILDPLGEPTTPQKSGAGWRIRSVLRVFPPERAVARKGAVVIARIVLAAVLCTIALPVRALCPPFTDVPTGDPFCGNIQWMFNRQITFGCTATQYCPAQFVRRDQMAAFMNRLGNIMHQQGGNAFGATAVVGATDGQPLHLLANGARVMRFEAGTSPSLLSAPNVIGGYSGNIAEPATSAATIAGGGSLGFHNTVKDEYTTVGGGQSNVAGHGSGSGAGATVAGGRGNVASGGSSAIAGGELNTASGGFSFVAGGFNNVASANLSFAAGHGARADKVGCFVLADATTSNATSCPGDHQIVMRALGGFYFWTAGTTDATYSGARLDTGTGAWAAFSDRNGKERIDPVDTGAVLDKLVAMPIATWQWKGEPGGIRHMGPMAQDFHQAFRLGNSDTQIVTVDADGVALAAIQGLNAKVEAQAREIAKLRAQYAEVLADLRTTVASAHRNRKSSHPRSAP